jgi:hypothetical protein
MAGMTDANATGNNLVPFLLQLIYGYTPTSGTAVISSTGTGAPASKTLTLPYKLRLTTTSPTSIANGAELTGTGYTAGGASLGASAFTGFSSRVVTNANSVSWAVGSTWTAVTSAEIVDSTATPLRLAFGDLLTPVTGAVNGDTVSFAASSITMTATTW